MSTLHKTFFTNHLGSENVIKQTQVTCDSQLKLLYGWANDFNEYIVFFDRFLIYIPFLESKKVQFRFMGVKGLKQSLK